MPLGQDELRDELERLVAEHQVPGAVVAYWQDGSLSTAAVGTANLNTGAPMTVDTGFLTGSITKVWATTLIMTLVEDGLIDLDAPIVHYAPEVRFGADQKIAETLLVRHLLNHSSGVDTGDLFVESRGYPDGVEDYLGPIAMAGKVTEPGVVSSYNNVGWIVAEMVLRHATGKNFHQLLRERVIDPLGLRRTVLSARQAILHPTAIGSFPDESGGHRPTPQFMFPDGWAAAGTTLITTVEDTIRFLRMHLGNGTSVDGRRIIGPEAAIAMRTPTSGNPTGPDSGFGLGWRYTDRDGHRVFSHAGGSLGGRAHAVISPDDNAAMIAFVNSSRGMLVHHDLIERAFPGRPSPLAPPDGSVRPDVDLRPFAGSYRRKAQRVDIDIDGDGLRVRVIPISADLAGATTFLTGEVGEFRAVAIGPTTLVSAGTGPRRETVAMDFSEPENSAYQLLYMGGRLARRVATGPHRPRA